MAAYGVSILGGSGYTGAELVRILTQHDGVEILHITSRELAGTPVSRRLPNLAGVDLDYENPDPRILADSDIVFVCVHHTESLNIVPAILENSRVIDFSADYRLNEENSRVIDFSADYRLNDRKLYESVYEVTHTSPEIGSVYGLPELHGEEIPKADLVANPGCYPTGAILALAPLVRGGLIQTDRIVIDSKSGTSGAGMRPSPFVHHPECADAVRPYKVTDHRHIAEMDQELSLVAGEDVKVNFTPHLIPIPRGILTTCHTFPESALSPEQVRSVYEDFYGDAPFVRIRDEVPDLRGVTGSNFCDIGSSIDARTGRLVVVSAIDNLTKGASGQAVQNMNLMFGLPETRALESLGLYP
jgi:N-acetyl-gamma-glutamyl-phosphate reductase